MYMYYIYHKLLLIMHQSIPAVPSPPPPHPYCRAFAPLVRPGGGSGSQPCRLYLGGLLLEGSTLSRRKTLIPNLRYPVAIPSHGKGFRSKPQGEIRSRSPYGSSLLTFNPLLAAPATALAPNC